jgi:hypothetical protein
MEELIYPVIAKGTWSEYPERSEGVSKGQVSQILSQSKGSGGYHPINKR